MPGSVKHSSEAAITEIFSCLEFLWIGVFQLENIISLTGPIPFSGTLVLACLLVHFHT